MNIPEFVCGILTALAIEGALFISAGFINAFMKSSEKNNRK